MSRDDARAPDSTLADVAGPDRPDHGLWARRIAVLVLALVQVTALTGWLGVHSGTARAERAGYSLEVAYPVVARAGLDVPLTLRIHAPRAIDHDVVVGISADYFRMFETQGFFPEPAEVTTDADTAWMTFSPPPAGRDLVIDYDAYIQPSSQRGKSAAIRVLTEGVERVAVTIRTTLLP